MIGTVIRFLDKILTFFEDWTLYLTVMVALISLFINVICRYGFNYPLSWSEELIREVIIYTTLIGCSAAVKNRSMIKIDALVQIVPSLKAPLNYFSHFCTLAFSVFMMYYGWHFAAMQVATRQATIILEIPLVYLMAILPLMGFLMFIRTIQIMYEDMLKAKAVGR
ncbi:MAG: TRAP transporter small permease [Deltaproteobacteria bacterium]|nr:TRAP transporter small permease [Deltaproteobacteria bacterium]